jgi:hypothetical protein
MRRHVATFVAAAFLFAMAGPAVAADPLPAASLAPAVAPSPEVPPTPEATPGPEVTPAPGPIARDLPDPTIAPKPAPSVDKADSADPTGRWIVVYRNGTNVAAASKRQTKSVGFTADRTFSHAFRGLSARLSPTQVTALRNDPAVLEVVPD